MTNKIAKVAVSPLLDILSFFKIPGTSTIKGVWDQIVDRKVQIARDILIEEIEEGNFSNAPQDELVSIIHRYIQASINGTAKLNLRLLAQLIKGITQNNEKLLPSLYASEFNRYSNILADLSYEELQILATLNKFKIQNEKEESRSGPQMQVSQFMRDNSHYSDKARKWLSGNSVNIDDVIQTHRRIMSPEEFDAIAASLVRTGLVYTRSYGQNFRGGANLSYDLTPLFFKLTGLVEFQSIFRNEE